MLKIGEFSKLSRVSIRMLRYYDEIDLLKPTLIDDFTGYRYYTEKQLIVINRITALKDMGFGLSDIKEILMNWENINTIEGLFYKKHQELIRIVEQTAQRIRILESAINRLGKEEIMKYNVTVKTFPDRYAATVRKIIPRYEDEGMLWGILMRETEQMNLIPDNPCYCCAVFHDKEYKEENVDVEVYKTVQGKYEDTENVVFKVLPKITVACATCKGSCKQMGNIMAEVVQWVTDNGYEFNGPVFNIYHVSPYETSNPDEFVPEVCYPVKKR